jgi:hypothetical protein
MAINQDQGLGIVEVACDRAVLCCSNDAGERRFVRADLKVLLRLDCEV